MMDKKIAELKSYSIYYVPNVNLTEKLFFRSAYCDKKRTFRLLQTHQMFYVRISLNYTECVYHELMENHGLLRKHEVTVYLYTITYPSVHNR